MRIILLLLFLSIVSCQSDRQNNKDEWIQMFNGKSTEGWRGYNSNLIPPGWIAKDGMLMFDRKEFELEQDYVGGRDLLYSKQQFSEFELYLEWKIPAGGNSGIFYHVQEGYDNPYEMSPEYQIIDDENYTSIHDVTEYNESFGEKEPEKLQDWQMTGANYAMHTVPDNIEKILYPTGQWNSSKILFTKSKVEHWLNDVLLFSFKPWSDEWYRLRNSGKWDEYPDYGKYDTGFIVLQDHGSPLWFRNIKIKNLAK